jgi:diketogulonate reductase-like aldo/keto reductase
MVDHLTRLLDVATVVPAVNQIECHPYFQQPDVQALGKSPAQVLLRWGLQHGRSVIPKSTEPTRIVENIDVFDFELGADEMGTLDALDTGQRGGPEPDAVTLETFSRDIPEARREGHRPDSRFPRRPQTSSTATGGR